MCLLEFVVHHLKPKASTEQTPRCPENGVNPVLSKVFPFDEAQAGYRHMLGRALWQNRHPRSVSGSRCRFSNDGADQEWPPRRTWMRYPPDSILTSRYRYSWPSKNDLTSARSSFPCTRTSSTSPASPEWP